MFHMCGVVSHGGVTCVCVRALVCVRSCVRVRVRTFVCKQVCREGLQRVEASMFSGQRDEQQVCIP